MKPPQLGHRSINDSLGSDWWHWLINLSQRAKSADASDKRQPAERQTWRHVVCLEVISGTDLLKHHAALLVEHAVDASEGALGALHLHLHMIHSE